MLGPFLVGVGVMCGISVVLAVMMVIADATIANYGTVKVKINKDKELEVDGGRSLLSTLMEEQIFIPSACGGRGSCGMCKVKVLDGAGDLLPTELPMLSADEKKQNVRLACQCKVKKDYSIEIPESLFNVKEYQVTVASLTDLTYDIKKVSLKFKPGDEINFKAGQFVQFGVPEYELTPEPVYRAYSVASSPFVKDALELEIRLVPNGICTTYVFKYLKEKDNVTINGPYGDFFLRDSERDIVFIAGGSGMAPIRSMLYEMKQNNNQRKAMYFFGARAVKDLFQVDEMRQFEKDLPNFRYIPALSAPDPGDNWEGDIGLITEVVAKYVESGSNVEAYLCGSPGMIDACIKVLKSKGVPEDLIFYDKFA
ncbi:MAG: 2Fe-2S iron-sulfur cluster-binding protein [Firmicutes bacterium]|nr:2Fe-2S iron-sulfur cluster-binding protein [Bacillota bacterium]